MKKVVLGTTVAGGTPVFLKENPVDTLNIRLDDSFFVELEVEGACLRLSLEDIRSLKRLLLRGEQQLELRHKQALLEKNLKLDI